MTTPPSGQYPAPHGQGYPQYGQPAHPPQQFAAPPSIQQAPAGPTYVRQQTGHSLILHLLFGGLLAYIPTLYYAFSPNHYFHA